MKPDDVELSHTEIIQTIVTIATTLIAARDITPAAAAALAVDIIGAAAEHADAARMALGLDPTPMRPLDD